MLGAIYFPATKDYEEGYRFAVWAPNATEVSLVGDFNGWELGKHPWRRLKIQGHMVYLYAWYENR